MWNSFACEQGIGIKTIIEVLCHRWPRWGGGEGEGSSGALVQQEEMCGPHKIAYEDYIQGEAVELQNYLMLWFYPLFLAQLLFWATHS